MTDFESLVGFLADFSANIAKYLLTVHSKMNKKVTVFLGNRNIKKLSFSRSEVGNLLYGEG